MPYANKAHRSVQQFWGNFPAQHPFAEHPLMRQHGNALAGKNFDFIEGRMGGEQYRHSTASIGGKIMRILQIEAQHLDQLTQLAKDTVAQVFGVDPSVFDAKITNMGETGEDKPDQTEEQQDEEQPAPAAPIQMTPQLRGDINKRVTTNALLHGSAIHSMLTIHHLVAPQLQAISPELLRLYTEIAGGTAIDTYFQNIAAMMAQTQGAQANQFKMGEEWVEQRPEQQERPAGEEPDEQQGEEGGQPPQNAPTRPVAVARAVAFPFLCHELAKGLMEIWSTHGLNDMEPEYLKEVYKHADRLEHEPFLYHVGPELWRQFLAVLPQGFNMKYVMATLFKLPQDRFNNLIHQVVSNPQQARPLIDQLMTEARNWETPPEEVQEWTPDAQEDHRAPGAEPEGWDF